jgi:hypothetical protein
MKKVVYSIILFAVIAVMYSCKPTPEQLAVGTWKLDSISVLNVDDLVNSTLQMQMGPIEEQLKSVTDELAKLDPKDKKNAQAIATLEETKKQIEAQKAQFNAETLKADILKGYNDMVGNMTFTYNEDKTCESKSFDMVEKGTWSVAEDGKSITIISEDKSEMKLMIEELTANKMIMTNEMASGDVVVKSRFVCSK